MHYATLVIVNPKVKIDLDMNVELTEKSVSDAVDDALARFGGDREGAHWDWYQIGGRWTGLFDNYDPDNDPANLEVCSTCEGTGTRKDWPPSCTPEWIAECNGCNGCKGTGKRSTWPTQWAFRMADTKPVNLLTEEDLGKFHTVCVDDSWYSKERFEYYPWKDKPGKFVKQERPPLKWLKEKFGDHLAVIVDCHN